MPRILVTAIAVLLPTLPLTAGAQTSGVSAAALERVAAVENKVVAWRRDIHQHPELGNRETRTAALVANHLRALGLDVTTGIAHTGVVGLLRGGRPGPVVMLRADMDALPVTERVNVPFASKARAVYDGAEVGVMHACGHDAHVAILMGVAEVLASLKDQVPGTVKFVFQPAEEGAPQGESGGAELMVEEGVLTAPDVDAAFALHVDSKEPVGHLFYRRGAAYASSDALRILVRGRQTHGGYPWNGTDPIVAAAQIITALQTIVSREMDITRRAAVVTIGRIRGGVRNNIIPEEVELVGTVRALHQDDRAQIHDRVRRIATNVAAALGATAAVDLPWGHAYPVTMNDDGLTDEMVPVLQAVAGEGRVYESRPQTGAEDFSFFAERVPGFYIGLGGRPLNVSEEDAADHHTPDFFIDDSGLGLGVRALTAMALHYLENRPTAERASDTKPRARETTNP